MEHFKRIVPRGCMTLLAAFGVSCGAHAAGAFDTESKWMSGDWGGTRTELLEKGYDFSLDYVGEVAGNLDGGYNNDKTAAARALGISVRTIHNHLARAASQPTSTE